MLIREATAAHEQRPDRHRRFQLARAPIRPDLLRAAIVDRLPGPIGVPDVRARWIVDAVTRLAPALVDRPFHPPRR